MAGRSPFLHNGLVLSPRQSLGWLAAVAALLILRRPDAFLRPQFWAEDGMFYVDALTRHAGSLSLPYAGYLHLAPRLAALVAAMADPLWAPAITTALAFGLTLTVFTRVMSGRVKLPGKPWLVLAVVLLPDPREVFFNITNLQWILALGLITLLVSDDAKRISAHTGDAAFILLCGLSGPFSLLFSPLFILRAWKRRSRAATVVALVVFITAAIQAGFLFWWAPVPADPTPAAFHWNLFPAVIGLRLGTLPFLGILSAHVSSPAVLGSAGFLALAGIALLLRPAAAPETDRGVLGFSLALTLIAALVRCRDVQPDLLVAENAQRYFFLPQVLLLWLLLTASPARKAGKIVIRILLLGFALTNLPGLRLPPFVDYHWSNYAREIRAGRACVFPVNPPGMTISCPALSR